MRLDLGGGQWADLRERLLYGQAKPIRVIFSLVERGGDAASLADLDMALVTGYVEAWNVLGLDGNAVPLDQAQLAPDDVIQTIALAAIDLWKGTAPLPKAGNGTSPSPRPVPPSIPEATRT